MNLFEWFVSNKPSVDYLWIVLLWADSKSNTAKWFGTNVFDSTATWANGLHISYTMIIDSSVNSGFLSWYASATLNKLKYTSNSPINSQTYDN